MKTKKKILYSSILIALFTIPSISYSASFCGDRTNVLWGGGSTITGDLTANDCYEIGAWVTGSENDYMGTGKNINMLDGSLLHVLGHFVDSTVNSGAEARISKTTHIAWDGYLATQPALGENITILTGGLVRVFDGGTLRDSLLNGGTAYISNSGGNDDAGISINNTTENGGKLFVYYSGRSEGTIINSGGYEYVQQDGQSTNTIINDGGSQFVKSNGSTEGTIINSGGLQQLNGFGFASNTQVKEGGKQYVVDNSKAIDTIIDGGLQIVFHNNTQNMAGIAENTIINNNGSQRVQSGGQAIKTTVNDVGFQKVLTGSTTQDTTFNQQATGWISNGAQALGITHINDKAQLTLVAGDNKSTTADTTGAYAQDVRLNNQDSSLIIKASQQSNNQAVIDKLSGQGNVHFSTLTYSDGEQNKTVYNTLFINELVGNLTFWMNTSLAENVGDYLTLAKSSGSHKLVLSDSGAEITDPMNTTLDLVTERDGDAHFDLASLDGSKINAIDGGTYVYYLNKREEDNNKIWYLGAKDETPEEPEKPGIEEPEKPGPEEPEKPGPEEPEKPGVIEPEKPTVKPPVEKETSPSTDAILSLSTAPQLIFNNELSNLRFRKGSLKNNEGNAGVWIRLIENRNRVGSDNTHFKLNQTGFELGADKVIQLEKGKLFAGGFIGYSDSKLKHQRGGESSLDSYTFGGYATYFDDNNWYVDGVLKYNHFKNELRAVSTNKSSISGDYSQNGYGGVVEAGYNASLPKSFWAEPYARLSYVRVDSKNVKLNNNMQADINNQQSLVSELGISAGKDFTLNTAIVSPYIKLAWSHEYISNNKVDINNRNSFKTDLSGDVGKYGAGLDIKLNNNIQIFTEVNYSNGSKVESPIQGNLGLRYNF